VGMLAGKLLDALRVAHAGAHHTMSAGRDPSPAEAEAVVRSLFALQREAVGVLGCLGPNGNGRDAEAEAAEAAAAAASTDDTLAAVAGFLLNSANQAAIHTQMRTLETFVMVAAGAADAGEQGEG